MASFVPPVADPWGKAEAADTAVSGSPTEASTESDAESDASDKSVPLAPEETAPSGAGGEAPPAADVAVRAAEALRELHEEYERERAASGWPKWSEVAVTLVADEEAPTTQKPEKKKAMELELRRSHIAYSGAKGVSEILALWARHPGGSMSSFVPPVAHPWGEAEAADTAVSGSPTEASSESEAESNASAKSVPQAPEETAPSGAGGEAPPAADVAVRAA